MTEYKKCPACKKIKNRIDDFYFSNGNKKRCSSFCKKCCYLSTRNWIIKNKDKIRQQKRDNLRKNKKKLFELLGNKCNECGFSDKRALQLDHKKSGDGSNDRRKLKMRMIDIYLKALKNPENYQILCANCNWIKKYENNEGSRVIL